MQYMICPTHQGVFWDGCYQCMLDARNAIQAKAQALELQVSEFGNLLLQVDALFQNPEIVNGLLVVPSDLAMKVRTNALRYGEKRVGEDPWKPYDAGGKPV